MLRVDQALGPSLFFAVAATCIPQAVSAQAASIFMLLPTEDRVLEVGRDHSGALSASDYVGENGAYLEAWALEGRTGESVRLELESDAFYPELKVAGPGLREPLAGNPCLDVTFLEDGTFHVVVTTWQPSSTGTYVVRVSEPSDDSSDFGCEAPFESSSLDTEILELPAEGRELSMGSSDTGRLGTGDPTVDGEYAEAWLLTAQPGERLVISMESNDFDTYLYVTDAAGVIESDDDGGSGTNSRIDTTLAGDGPFTVVATAYSGSGAYTIRVEEEAHVEDEIRAEALPTDGRSIGPGQTVQGRLGASDPEFRGRSSQAWAFEGTAGDGIVVELSSDDFDPYLYVVGPGLDESNDDGGGNLDSLLEITLPESGTYRIIASAYSSGVGAYTLSVGDRGSRALPDAVERGDLDSVERFLEEGGDPNESFRYEGVNGVTALFVAIGEEHPDIVSTLLEHGADPNVSVSADGISGLTPLALAAVERHADIAVSLLEHGAEVDSRISDDENDMTLLAAAASEGDVEIVRLLLDHGADPNAQVTYEGNANMTPLAVADSERHPEVVQILREYGAGDPR